MREPRTHRQVCAFESSSPCHSVIIDRLNHKDDHLHVVRTEFEPVYAGLSKRAKKIGVPPPQLTVTTISGEWTRQLVDNLHEMHPLEQEKRDGKP